MDSREITSDGRTSCCVGLSLISLSVGSAVALASGWTLGGSLALLVLSAVALGLLGLGLILRGVLASLATRLGDSTLLVSGRPPGPDVLSVPERDRATGSGLRTRAPPQGAGDEEVAPDEPEAQRPA